MDRPRFRAADLHAFIAGVLGSHGVPAEDARQAADVLIYADLAGIESHGIAHLATHRAYVPGLKSGDVNPRETVLVLRESPVSAAWDAGGGMGVAVAPRAMGACIAKAESAGIGMITVANGRHFGAAGYYAKMAANRGLIGMAMCNAGPRGVAAGGVEPVLGTNPIAIGVPSASGEPFLLDMATTAVAAGKLEIARRVGRSIPEGWAIDAGGRDSTDPQVTERGGSLLPLGSRLATSSYKGSGLGMAVDMFTGLLSGQGAGYTNSGMRARNAFWFAAWRIDLFRDPGEFMADVEAFIARVGTTRPEPGVERVLVAGEKEAIARADREANGIPLEPPTVAELRELAAETGIALPAPIS
ncbi:MAG: Ldh family oxidoreductase [Dehalococcoidia bacterium]|nr:Ldh family oxidoreductase [Dehalococcoidia bacterium]